jgi:hypothetical protein
VRTSNDWSASSRGTSSTIGYPPSRIASARVVSATMRPLKVTRTRPEWSASAIGWSGPGIFTGFCIEPIPPPLWTVSPLSNRIAKPNAIKSFVSDSG